MRSSSYGLRSFLYVTVYLLLFLTLAGKKEILLKGIEDMSSVHLDSKNVGLALLIKMFYNQVEGFPTLFPVKSSLKTRSLFPCFLTF